MLACCQPRGAPHQIAVHPPSRGGFHQLAPAESRGMAPKAPPLGFRYLPPAAAEPPVGWGNLDDDTVLRILQLVQEDLIGIADMWSNVPYIGAT